MKRLLRHSLFIFCIGLLLSAIACKDESLREELEIREKNEGNDDDYNDDEYIRVVTNPEAALVTPNSVMAKPKETITIPIAKAFAVWEQEQKLYGKKFSTKGDLGVVLLWAFPYDLIDSEQIEILNYEDINKAVIKLKSKLGVNGNALIALTVAGEVRWSWHIWITDYNPADDLQLTDLQTGANDIDGGKVYRYKNYTGDNIYMDRNLGANSADKTQRKETLGMYYQWGRKDPLPGFAPPNYIPQDLFDLPPEYRRNNLAYSIEFPDELIVSAGNHSGDWYSYYVATHSHDLWGAVSGTKSIYDPCPEGWKVPLMAKEAMTDPGWGQIYTPWHIMESENEFVQTNPTTNLDCESPVLGFYPESGALDFTGELSKYERSAALWTATASPNTWDERSYMTRLMGDPPSILNGRGYALNVRCIRILNNEENK